MACWNDMIHNIIQVLIQWETESFENAFYNRMNSNSAFKNLWPHCRFSGIPMHFCSKNCFNCWIVKSTVQCNPSFLRIIIFSFFIICNARLYWSFLLFVCCSKIKQTNKHILIMFFFSKLLIYIHIRTPLDLQDKIVIKSVI